MGATYDTAEIRRLAKRVEAAAGQIRAASSDDIGRVQAESARMLRGATAEALTGRLAQIADDLAKSAGRLAEIDSLLIKLAHLLDEADEQARTEIQSK